MKRDPLKKLFFLHFKGLGGGGIQPKMTKIGTFENEAQI